MPVNERIKPTSGTAIRPGGMNKVVVVPLLILLSGCPGDKLITSQRSVFIFGDALCFSVNRTEILDHYNVYYYPKGKYTVIESSDDIKLSYPDTCFKFNLKKGYRYNIYYGLNGKHYTDSLFIDNDGN